MAKKDNNRGGPIEFRITSGPGGRENVPTPVNQPNWIYGSTSFKSKPTIYEWSFITLTTILISMFIAVIIPQGAWVLSFTCALIPTLWIISAISRARYHSKESRNQREQ
jgi:hypothetical protein